jgi:hypothetical protein
VKSSINAAVLTICKDDFDGFSRTLQSIRPLHREIQLLCIVRCAGELKYLYEAQIAYFPFALAIFNQDSGLYNAMNLALDAKRQDLPYMFLNAGDFLPACSLQLFLSCAKRIRSLDLFCFNTLVVDAKVVSGSVFDLELLVRENRGRMREPRSRFLSFLKRELMFPCHQSIIYGPGFSFLRFFEDSSYASDIFYNSNAFRASKAIFYSDRIMSCFDDSGVSSTLPPSARLRDRLKVIKMDPRYLLDRRISFGTLSLLLKFFFHSLFV